ncbi:LuxR C-terminal-related transcriptional regulator [Streptomyces sp. NPDC012616]|uniref:response regulator transcription factor n=1 Tax=Streptomyces sp. NPDC012616 TaxID=3364840 RepID=UPI0036EAAA81
MTKVSIVGDTPIFRYGLSRILEDHGFMVSCVGARGIGTASDVPDVALVDWELLCTRPSAEVLGNAAGRTALLVMCNPWAVPSKADANPLIRGTISREATPDQLVLAVRTLAAGESFFPGAGLRTFREREPAGEEQISPREREVLFGIARGSTHAQIARYLGISPHTVDTYVRRIRTKLGVGNKAELTRVALLFMVNDGQWAS